MSEATSKVLLDALYTDKVVNVEKNYNFLGYNKGNVTIESNKSTFQKLLRIGDLKEISSNCMIEGKEYSLRIILTEL